MIDPGTRCEGGFFTTLSAIWTSSAKTFKNWRTCASLPLRRGGFSWGTSTTRKFRVWNFPLLSQHRVTCPFGCRICLTIRANWSLWFRDFNARKQLVKCTFRYGITRRGRINLCPDDFRLSLVNQVKVREKFRCRFLIGGSCWYRLTRESFFVLFRFYEVGFPSLILTSATSPASASPRKMPDNAAIIASFPEGGTILLSWFFVITTTPN